MTGLRTWPLLLIAACAHNPPPRQAFETFTVKWAAPGPDGKEADRITDTSTGATATLVFQWSGDEWQIAQDNATLWDRLPEETKRQLRAHQQRAPALRAGKERERRLQAIRSRGVVECKPALRVEFPDATGSVSYSWAVDSTGKAYDIKREHADRRELADDNLGACLDQFIMDQDFRPWATGGTRVKATFRF